MALEPSSHMATKIGDQAKGSSLAIPLVSSAELEEHRRLPHVRARLNRVQRLIASRAQQKV